MQSSHCRACTRTGASLIKDPGGAARDPAEADARDWLEADEIVVAVLTGDGADLLATDRRIVIVRSGAGFRPRTGVRSWTYDRIAQVALSRPSRGQALIVVRTGHLPWQAVSMFFDSRLWPEAERVIDETRRHLNPQPRG